MSNANSGGLLETTPSTVDNVLAEVKSGGIQVWTEDKKKGFVGTFKNRSKAARFILLMTAQQLLESAQRRRFISDKHLRQEARKNKNALHVDMSSCPHDRDEHGHPQYNTYGGRPQGELADLAKLRAEAILDQLPSAKKAAAVILPDIAKKMDRRDALLEEGEKLIEELETLCVPVSMKECLETSPRMTLATFHQLVVDKEEKRDELIKKLDKIGKQGCELEDAINKALYEGFPGLSDAVIGVIAQHIERATMMDMMVRRVEEQVLYGDSDAALAIFKRFEDDEVTVSTSIKDEFAKALEALNLAASQRKAKK